MCQRRRRIKEEEEEDKEEEEDPLGVSQGRHSPSLTRAAHPPPPLNPAAARAAEQIPWAVPEASRTQFPRRPRGSALPGDRDRNREMMSPNCPF